MRESLTDPYFPRRLSGLSCNEQQLRAAMDIFGNVILKTSDSRRAKAELEALAEIEARDAKAKEKCIAVWRIISGEA